MSLRIILGLILLFSAVNLPIYITAVLAIFCLYKFDNYYEIVFVFFIHDALYGIPLDRFYGFTFVATLIALVSVIVSNKLHKMIFSKNMRLS